MSRVRHREVRRVASGRLFAPASASAEREAELATAVEQSRHLAAARRAEDEAASRATIAGLQARERRAEASRLATERALRRERMRMVEP